MNLIQAFLLVRKFLPLINTDYTDLKEAVAYLSEQAKEWLKVCLYISVIRVYQW
jgi:hypothetical protein